MSCSWEGCTSSALHDLCILQVGRLRSREGRGGRGDGVSDQDPGHERGRFLFHCVRASPFCILLPDPRRRGTPRELTLPTRSAQAGGSAGLSFPSRSEAFCFERKAHPRRLLELVREAGNWGSWDLRTPGGPEKQLQSACSSGLHVQKAEHPRKLEPQLTCAGPLKAPR